MESCPGFGEGHKRFDFTVEKKNFIGNFQIKPGVDFIKKFMPYT